VKVAVMPIRSIVPITSRKAVDPDDQATLTIHQWPGAPEFPAVRLGKDVYLAVRSLCEYFGVRSSAQIDSLQRHKLLARYVRMFKMQTRGGKQPTWCIHIRAVCSWACNLDPDELRAEIEAGVLEWDDVLLNEAGRLFVDTERMALVETGQEPGLLAYVGPESNLEVAELRSELARTMQYHESLFRQMALRITRLEHGQRAIGGPYVLSDTPDVVDEG
jgi:hypothetical protein